MFEMIPRTDNFAFRQNTIHGGQPIVQSYPPTNACTCHGDCEIPNIYNKTSVDMSVADIHNGVHINTEHDTLFSNIDLSNYFTKSEVDDIENELSTLILNTYSKTDVCNLLYTSYPSLSLVVNNLNTKCLYKLNSITYRLL